MASLSACSDAKKIDRRRTSCETLCSSNSSCVLQKRKLLHPLATSVRSKNSSNPVTQRVLSAKLLRLKTLQNQLNDANYHINELVNENKLLKNLQRRQDQALSKYEGASAQLPQVLESHREEIRVIQVRNKNLKKTVKDLSDQLKNKDEEINSLKDQNKHLLSLCKNKNLEERRELADKIDELNEKLEKSETKISMLNRKLLLESKNYKFKLNSEVNKHKETQRELTKALSRLKEFIPDDKDLRKKSSNRKSQSVIALTESKNIKKILPNDVNNSLVMISHKNRTSSGSSNATILEESSIISDILPDQQLESSSEVQLKEIVNNWQKKNNKIDKMEEEFDENMKSYAKEILKEVKQSNDSIDKQTIDLNKSIKDTNIILETLKGNDTKQAKLSQLITTGSDMSFYDYTFISAKTTNDKKLSQLKEIKSTTMDYSFEDELLSESIKGLKITEPEVDEESKNKLLAKLKAIDNGDNVVVNDVKKTKCDLMKELFGT